MRGLGLVIGFIMGNATARKWCLDNLKKASVIIDQEVKKTPMGKLFCSMVPERQKTVKEKERNDE